MPKKQHQQIKLDLLKEVEIQLKTIKILQMDNLNTVIYLFNPFRTRR